MQLDGGTDYRRMHAEEDDAPVRTVVTAADGSSAALAAADADEPDQGDRTGPIQLQ